MTHQNLSADLDSDEPRLSGGRIHLWIAITIAALLVGGTTASAVVLSQSDNIANQRIAADHAAQADVTP